MCDGAVSQAAIASTPNSPPPVSGMEFAQHPFASHQKGRLSASTGAPRNPDWRPGFRLSESPKNHENRMNPMKIMPLCTGPPKTLTFSDNGVRCVRGRPLCADEPRTLMFEGLFAGPFNQGVAGQASPPPGQRRPVCRGERVGQGVAVTAAIAPSDSRSIEARWKSTGRNADGLRADGPPIDASKPRVAVDRVTPVDPRCRRSGVEKQRSCFKWNGPNSCLTLHQTPLSASRETSDLKSCL